ncbi:MAG: DnaJ domain-containing protein [Planctomycetota bacterium]
MFLRLRPTRPPRSRPCRACGADAEGERLQFTVYEPRPRRTPRRWGSLGQTAACCLGDPQQRRALLARAEDQLARLALEHPDAVDALREALERLLPRPEAPPGLDALGLHDDASAEDVRRAYHALARRAHPDVGGDAAAFAQLNAAYQSALAWVDAQG